MANVDKPNGFRFVKTLSGAPLSALIKYVGVADGEDIFIGDLINLESGLADPCATNDAAILGVAVGFGKVDGDGIPLGAFNPETLTTRFYDDSANTHTEWVVYYVPAGVFEAQTATALTLAIGTTCDLADATGSSTTGMSAMEITTSSSADLTVVEVPKYVDNDNTLVHGKYWVMVTKAEQAFHA